MKTEPRFYDCVGEKDDKQTEVCNETKDAALHRKCRFFTQLPIIVDCNQTNDGL